jgi:integrase
MQERPWFRAQTWTWYLEVNGKQYPLGKHPSDEKPAKGKRGWSPPPEILAAWHQRVRGLGLQDAPGTIDATRNDISLKEVAHRFLADVKGHIQDDTGNWYRVYLQDFLDRHPGLEAAAINRELVRAWLDLEREPTWGVSSIRAAICSLKRCLNWAVEQRIIRANPIASVKKPKARGRTRILEATERPAILELWPDGDPFRDVLVVLEQTGCRPGELAKVRRADVNLEAGTWELKGKDFNATGRIRVVYLTPAALEITRRLMLENPGGPIFRNADGNPWNRKAINNRLARKKARKKDPMPRDVVAYTYRHTYATDALANGVDGSTVQELMGHRSPEMMRNYTHLHARPEYMRAAASKAVRIAADPATDPPSSGAPSSAAS